jgi:hypothetical protein
MRSLITSALCISLAGICSAVVIHENKTYRTPLKRISGSVVGYGNVNPGVMVEIFERPELWAESEKRKRQRLIARTATDANGRFDFRGVPKGAYEVQFSPFNGGWNVLSVLVTVNTSGSNDRLCVQLSLDGGAGPASSVETCH